MVEVGEPIGWVEGEDDGGGFGDLLAGARIPSPTQAPSRARARRPRRPSHRSPPRRTGAGRSDTAGPIAAVPRARGLAREHGIDLATVSPAPVPTAWSRVRGRRGGRCTPAAPRTRGEARRAAPSATQPQRRAAPTRPQGQRCARRRGPQDGADRAADPAVHRVARAPPRRRRRRAARRLVDHGAAAGVRRRAARASPSCCAAGRTTGPSTRPAGDRAGGGHRARPAGPDLRRARPRATRRARRRDPGGRRGRARRASWTRPTWGWPTARCPTWADSAWTGSRPCSPRPRRACCPWVDHPAARRRPGRRRRWR